MIDLTASRTQLTGREKSIPFFDPPACPVGFVLAEVDELRPAGILDSLSQTMVLNHPLDVQVLKGNEAETRYQVVAELVVKVPAPVGDPLVLEGHYEPGLIPIVGTLLLAAQPALTNFQASFGFTQVLRRLDFLACGKGHKILETKINTNLPISSLRLVHLHFAQNRDEVFVGLCFRHGNTFHLAFDGPVKYGLDPTNLWQIDSIVVNLEALGVADSLNVVFAMVLGIAQGHPVLTWFLSRFGPGKCPLFDHPEVVLIGPVKVFERLLQNLAIGLFQPGQERLDYLEHIGRVVVAKALAVLEKVRLALGQGSVVNESGAAELNGQRGLLLLIRGNPKPKRLFDFQCTPQRLRD